METNTAVIELKRTRREHGTGGVYERPNGRWQIQYYDQTGRKRRETYSTEAKARKKLDQRIAQRDAGTLETASTSRVKIDALADSYKLYAKNSAPKSYWWLEMVWRVHLEPFFGGKAAARIGSDDIQAYIGKRLGDGVKTSTVNRELQVFKAIFHHGAATDPPKIARVPRFPEKLAEPKPRSGFLTADQYEALTQHCPQPLRALLAVGYTFGFRKSELLRLRVREIDFKAGTISLLVGETKSGEGRTVYMTADVHDLLSEAVKGKQPGDHVFTWPDGRPIRDFRAAWATMTKAAGLDGLLVHDLRRTAVRNLVRAGVSRDVARKISGHETDSIFSRYNITELDDLADAAKKLENSRKMAASDSGSEK
jgi:integrase